MLFVYVIYLSKNNKIYIFTISFLAFFSMGDFVKSDVLNQFVASRSEQRLLNQIEGYIDKNKKYVSWGDQNMKIKFIIILNFIYRSIMKRNLKTLIILI